LGTWVNRAVHLEDDTPADSSNLGRPGLDQLLGAGRLTAEDSVGLVAHAPDELSVLRSIELCFAVSRSILWPFVVAEHVLHHAPDQLPVRSRTRANFFVAS
jgi:hypothetical protein